MCGCVGVCGVPRSLRGRPSQVKGTFGVAGAMPLRGTLDLRASTAPAGQRCGQAKGLPFHHARHPADPASLAGCRRLGYLCRSALLTGELSGWGGGGHRGGEGSVELAGDVALEAASDLAEGLALCGAPREVGTGLWAVAHPAGGDGVDGAVEGSVAAAVEAVADGAAAAGL